MCDDCLEWSQRDYDKIAKRVLKLSDQQIARLFRKIGLEDTQSMLALDEVSQLFSADALTENSSKERLFHALKAIENEN